MTYSEKYLVPFTRSIRNEDGCWRWTGTINPKTGYSNVTWGDVNTGHRIAWTLFNGPIPDGMTIDHACRIRDCVNPDHLRLATPRQQSRWSNVVVNLKSKDACPQGHPYPESYSVRPNGTRFCRVCNADRARAHRAKVVN